MTTISENAGTFTANGTKIVSAKSAAAGNGNFTTIYVWASNWDSGTLTVSCGPSATQMFAFTDSALTADGFINLNVKCSHVQLVLSGAGGSLTGFNYVVM